MQQCTQIHLISLSKFYLIWSSNTEKGGGIKKGYFIKSKTWAEFDGYFGSKNWQQPLFLALKKNTLLTNEGLIINK